MNIAAFPETAHQAILGVFYYAASTAAFDSQPHRLSDRHQTEPRNAPEEKEVTNSGQRWILQENAALKEKREQKQTSGL